MADYELIEERLISGRGTLRLPAQKDDFRHLVLYLDVIRQPRNKYINKNWNPDRSKYAFLSFLRKGYVVSIADMEFEHQAYDNIADIAGQTLIAVKCAYEGTLITFVNLGLALGAPPISYQDLIKGYENLNLIWDEIKFVCYSSTAIQARLYRLKYDSCDPNKDKKKRPPKPPPALPPVPPDMPIGDISPPYDDSDDTSPYPGDESPPPAPPWGDTVRCQKYSVTFRVYGFRDLEGGVLEDSVALWGEIKAIEARSDAVYIQSRGYAFQNYQCEDDFVWRIIRTYQYRGQQAVANPEIVSVVPMN